ncbi:Pre-B-cell leukemia transcription factor-interacting protein 1 [Rhizoctonia solani]|uniref:non-specific serine/threonine protein kinase n=1 Tax=Rhizoctonia solani TaxID=456999 RepID=A0A8H8SX67_9AGAM|nr:Pre-B-cell leukemia transcription factor-interacting protein 1 [Rhizoctonia solani]QRW20232.1 Pre-B-cell leukemia transcription factor-interacting protein 1 [Rhizoctonia solani]
MSDLPAPIFKRTKSRPNRARPPSPEPENATEDKDSGTGAMGLVAKVKSKQKARAKPPAAKLSFGQDEEGDSTEGATAAPKVRKSKLANPSAIRMPETLEQATISNSGPVYDKAYLDQLKAATMSAPPAAAPDGDVEMTLDIEEADGAMVVDTGDVGDVFDAQHTKIPLSSAVIEAKKKREQMRVTGKTNVPQQDEFISLSLTRRDEDAYQGPHPESRLQREDDDLGEGDDDDAEYTGAQERIALGKKGRKEAERARKAGMLEMIEDVEDDEETREWEMAQVRRGGSNNRNEVVEEKPVYKPHAIPVQTPVPTLGPAVARLTQALTKLTTSHAANTKTLTSLGDERSSLEKQEARLRELVTEAEDKRAWFSGFKEWMDSLADFLDEKFPKIEKIEEEFISLLAERAEMISKRRLDDMSDDLSLFLGAPSAGEEMEVVDELGRTVPSSTAPQSAVRRVRREARQSRRSTRPSHAEDQEGYSTDGSLGSSDAQDLTQAIALCRTKASSVFSDVTAEEFRDPRKGVAKWFGEWRERWGDSYTGAWGGLGVVGAWEMWVRLEVLVWDPVIVGLLRAPLDFVPFVLIGCGRIAEHLTPSDDLVLSMTATAIIPRLSKLIQAGALDPYSGKHVKRLRDVVEQIEAIVQVDPAKLNPLLGACIEPFRKAVDGLHTQLGEYNLGAAVFDPEGIPARTRYLVRVSKLVANLVAWRKYTGEKFGVGELIERVLSKVMLPVAEGGWEFIRRPKLTLGHTEIKEATNPKSLGTSPAPSSRSTTPTPGNPDPESGPLARTGLLLINVLAARGLTLPAGVSMPPAVEKALNSQQAQIAASVTSSSVSQRQQAKGHKTRDSMQRKQCWWLPYVVLEFDKNEVLIDALGGEIAAPVWMYQTNFDVSRASEISLQIYLRSGSSNATTNGSDDMGKSDIFLGNVKLTPDFELTASPIPTLVFIIAYDNYQGVKDEWLPVAGGSGQINVQVSYKQQSNAALTIDSFDLLKVIGKGSFGKVMQVRKRDTSRIYALKTIRKAHIASRGEITHTLAERTVLAQVNNPFIVPLKFCFQSEAKLYLVLAFINGGELFHHLQREQRFNEERSRFYAAELLLALEHLHDFNVVYRDLKPENILLDYTGHIALCDFGLCKLNMSDSDTTNTFCGVYVSAPLSLYALLLKGTQEIGRLVDTWRTVVRDVDWITSILRRKHQRNVPQDLQDPLRFGDEIGPDARSLLTGLLTRDPAARLGVNGAEDIKKHPFFAKNIDFKKLVQKKIQPPFKPSVASAIDTSNFDDVFTSEQPLDSVVDSSELGQSVQDKFAGFSYDGRDANGNLTATGQSYIG